jgi:hypothetical protein
MFDQLVLATKSHILFLEVAYSFEKRLEYAEDEMLRAVLLV